MKKTMLSRLAFVAALVTGAMGCQEESLTPKNEIKSVDAAAASTTVQPVSTVACTGPRLHLLPGGVASLQGPLLTFSVQVFNSGSGTASLDQPGNQYVWDAYLSVDGGIPSPSHFASGLFTRPVAPFGVDSAFGFFNIAPGEDLSIYKFIVIHARLIPGNTVGDCSGDALQTVIQPLVLLNTIQKAQ